MRHEEKHRTGWLMDESAMLDAYEGKECEACGMRGDDCECKLEPEPEPEKETKDMSKLDLDKIIASDGFHLLRDENESWVGYQLQRLLAWLRSRKR